MSNLKFPFLLLFLLIFTRSRVQSHEDGHITAEISNTGLDFLKDLLIKEAESSLVPLDLPKIEKTVKIPVIGNVHVVLSNIRIESIHVTSSTLKTGDSGVVIDVSGATANLSMSWKYEYHTWLLPISVSDKGNATTIQVEGLEVGLTLSLKTIEGSLRLSLLECGCYVKNISIKLDGGASWLYQGFLDAFEGKIGSAVEDAVPKKITNAIERLDSLLQSLPKEVSVTSVAALNVTFVDDPELSESAIDLQIEGLFCAKNEVALPSYYYHRIQQASASCRRADKMVKISMHEDVLKSAVLVYLEANKMHWIVDKIPDQSLLNTAGWRFIIPQLYKKYPNHDMNLNLSISSPPTIEVGKSLIMAQVPIDMVIDVLDAEETIPVLCISMVVSASASADISGNTLTGIVKLNGFTLSQKWSSIGDLHMYLIQTLISATLRTVVLPYVNLKLSQGFQIPPFHGYELQDAQILCTNDWIVICSDIAPVKAVQSRLVSLY